MSTEQLVSALLTALTAYSIAVPLQEEGMILQPLRARLELWWNRPHRRAKRAAKGGGNGYENLSDSWLWKPIIGCWRCMSGQAGLWTFLFVYCPYRFTGPGGAATLLRYNLLAFLLHLAFIMLVMGFAHGFDYLYEQWKKKN